MLDFTIKEYIDLCLAFNNYTTYTVEDYFKGNLESNYIILRHDVDRSVNNAKRIARIEYELGIRSTYYFRFPYTFNKRIIKEINNYGHEIGYHYEVMRKAGGNIETAKDYFIEELNEFRKIANVTTVAMHGSPLSKYNNIDFWKHYNLKDFNLIGEAFLDFKDIMYFSDTGRNWNNRFNIRDKINNDSDEFLRGTNDLIYIINNKKYSKLYISSHPERWSDNLIEWTYNLLKDFIFNIIKVIIKVVRHE